MDDTQQPDMPPPATGEDAHIEHAQAAQEVLQRIVDELVPRMAHRSPASVRDRLMTAIADAGLAPPPDAWLTATVTEIAAGRRVIMDARYQPSEAELERDIAHDRAHG